jgi:hypothetical protein
LLVWRQMKIWSIFGFGLYRSEATPAILLRDVVFLLMVCGVLKGPVSVAEFHVIILEHDSVFGVYFWFTFCFRKPSSEKLQVFLPLHAYKYYTKTCLMCLINCVTWDIKLNVKFCFDRNEIISLAEDDLVRNRH